MRDTYPEYVRVRVEIYPVNGRMLTSEIKIHPEVIDQSLVPLPQRPVFPTGQYSHHDVEEFERAIGNINARHRKRELTARRIASHIEVSLMRWFAAHDPEPTEK